MKLNDFLKLSKDDRLKNFDRLSDEDKAEFRFLHDIPKARVIGYEKINDEDRARYRKILLKKIEDEDF